jgi:formate dehydrogenase major subunit
MLMEAWLGRRPDRRRAAPSSRCRRKTNWKTDLSGGIQRVAIKHGCAPFGNAKARAVVWTFPDPVPLHREPLYTNRRDLVDKYPTYEDRRHSGGFRPSMRRSRRTTSPRTIPIILTSGRLVEYEGGGDETRSNPWLAELQQDMFVEINPRDANNLGMRTATWSGWKVRKAARSRSWPW